MNNSQAGNRTLDNAQAKQSKNARVDAAMASGVSPVKKGTADQYEKIVRRLVKFSTEKRSFDILEPVAVSPAELVHDLYDRPGLVSGSFNTYRAALLWHFGQKLDNPPYKDGYDLLVDVRKKPGSSPKTTKKRKTISEGDLHLLIEELSDKARRSKWAYRALYWLNAGLASGLRPIEWDSAQWVDAEQTILEVTTAKQKAALPGFIRAKLSSVQPDENHGADEFDENEDEEGMGSAPVQRQILIMNEQDRFFIEVHLKLLEENLSNELPLKKYYNNCRLALWRACQRLWGGKKQYSFYIMRSQFSANRRAIVGSAATAKLMDHTRVDSPSAASYGKANQAHRGYVDRYKAGLDTAQQESATETQAATETGPTDAGGATPG